MIRLEVRRGERTGTTLEPTSDVVRIGRAEGNDLVVSDTHVSSEHAKVVFSGDRYVLVDQRSTNGTAILRHTDQGPQKLALDDSRNREASLEDGDVIELGSQDRIVHIGVTIREDEGDTRVFAMKKIEELVPQATIVEKDDHRLRALYEAQKLIGAAQDLSEVLVAICESSFALVPLATHVTIVLRDDDDDSARSANAAGYVPVLTRVRNPSSIGRELAPKSSGASSGVPSERSLQPSGPVPITRSVFRKVVTERAAVVAADAPREVGQSESLMGAQIRSTLGIPLWKGEEILGVIQVDNREANGVLTSGDLEIMAVLAHNASLAVANARLVKRLRAAEERLKKENTFLKTKEQERRSGSKSGGAPEIIGQSTPMKHLLQQLEKVVNTRVTVLIEGETGAGKELVAASVHYRSNRKDRLFVGQNCAAMPETLLESELFGHRKGSFTGAHEDKKGLFEIADGGTLFLDEVTEMALSLQSKLLRALQEGEVRPIGATQEKKVNVRIVAATNRNLEKEVAEGRFREDLYYRLKVFPLRVPPLRERREDIPLIAEHFLHRFATEFGRPTGGFSQQAMELLQSYDWPGNVRELQNEVQRLCIQIEEGGFVTPEMLSPRVRQVEGMVERIRPTKGTLKEMVDQVERWLLIEALREHQNNKTAAAKALGITREGLHKKLRAFGL
ncbi:Response regulator of zinc sigma-54-dependent two-component system [Labilithrix luteola]|uniref:Response regulator of zinc sigma-54-dependent two-component system n=1 Tax=Labilithrix luteola TaxID=1391654 RepID=A0A0K1PKI4_9BACT|nr:sigma 54-interacting transcriptional regulator [Labilithrix luteola]AKU94027.1 Response regulator of zinc sigma-54-dependent two-component system [Labilithrix luteola]